MKKLLSTASLVILSSMVLSCGEQKNNAELRSTSKPTAALSQLNGSLKNANLEMLRKVCEEVLGEEFFGPENIGGAATFKFSNTNQSSVDIIKSIYKTFHNTKVNASPVFRPDRTKIEGLFYDMNVKADSNSDQATKDKVVEILDLTMKGINSNSKIAVVAGSWTDTGLGDPYGSLIALVDFENREVLILEQGYAD